MVLDTGGVDDNSFNQSSYAGMKAAQQANPNIKISYVAVELAERLHAEPQRRGRSKCNTIVAVGGLMADNVKAVADGQPDAALRRGRQRLAAARTSTASSSTPRRARFLGGYLAAGMSKTGKVATFGGLNIPPVTIYMDGFWEGVQYYNKQKGKNVQVLGWDETNQKGGTFAGSPSPTRTRASRSARRSSSRAPTSSSRSPVAPGWAPARPRRPPAARSTSIWVDTDGCVSAAQYCAVLPHQRDQEPVRLGQAVRDRGRQRAPSRPAPTSARWRTTAPAWRRSTTSTRRSRRTLKSELDAGQGRHHQRQDQDHLAVAADS